MSFDPNFKINNYIPDAIKAELKPQAIQKLSEILGYQIDDVVADYILMMVGNQKSLQEIEVALHDFIGANYAPLFCRWLYETLFSYKAAIDGLPSQAIQEDIIAKPSKVEKTKEAEIPSKVISLTKTQTTSSSENVVKSTKQAKEPQSGSRIISLKRITGTNSSQEPKQVVKNTVGNTKKTILNLSAIRKEAEEKQRDDKKDLRSVINLRKKKNPDLRDLIKKRQERFGVAYDDKEENKPVEQNQVKKAQPKVKNTRELGPIVNLEQAAMEVRSTLGNSRKKMRMVKQEEMELDMNKETKNGQEVLSIVTTAPPPPLPPSSSAPFSYNNAPLSSPYYPPPMYPPYGPPSGYYPPRVNYYGSIPRGYGFSGINDGYNHSLSFQSKTWVNPEISAAAAAVRYSPQAYTNYPRPHPRYGNKKWVRSEESLNTTPQQDEALSASLPKTPPMEES